MSKTFNFHTTKLKNKQTGEWESSITLKGKSAYEAAVEAGLFSGTEEEYNNFIKNQRDEAIQAIQDEGSTQVQNVQTAAQDITGKVEQIQQNTDDITELKGDLGKYNNKYKFNALDKDNLTNDSFIYSDGIRSSKGWRCTDYIECNTGDRVLIGLTNGKNLPFCCLYDADKNFINMVYSTKTSDERVPYDGYITLKNVSYARFNIVPDSLLPLESNYLIIEKNAQYLDNIAKLLDEKVNNDVFESSLERCIVSGKKGWFSSDVESPYDDLDTFPINHVVCYGINSIPGLKNYPIKFKSGFTLVSINYLITSQSGCMQIAVDLVQANIAIRINSGGWSSWYYPCSIDEVNEIYSHKVYYVGSNRTGDDCFTTLKACTECITTNNIQNSTVYVDAETFDLVEEYGQEYLDSIQSTTNKGFGLHIGNNTHFIFAEGSKVVFNYEGTNSDCAEFFSPFNVTGSVTLENANIEVSNARYCVHEDLPTSAKVIPDYSTVKYINCVMEHKGDTIPSGSHSGYCCIGGGTNKNTLSILKGGNYKSVWQAPVSYHNYNGNYPSKIILENVWMDKGFRLADFGTNEVEVQITGCYIPSGIIGTHTYFTITEWNNSFSN